MNAVVSMAFGDDYLKLSQITFPSFHNHASKIGADFIVLASRQFPEVFYEKFQMERLFSSYERLLWVDPDCWIKPSCPNLFDIVQPNCFGAFDELPRHPGGAVHVRQAQMDLNYPIKPSPFYFNSGVMVLSRYHQPLFFRPKKLLTVHFTEQTHLNLRLVQSGQAVHRLPDCFNSSNLKTAQIAHLAQQSHRQRIRQMKILSNKSKNVLTLFGKSLKWWQ